jgi:hypothetical protein
MQIEILQEQDKSGIFTLSQFLQNCCRVPHFLEMLGNARGTSFLKITRHLGDGLPAPKQSDFRSEVWQKKEIITKCWA